MKKISVIFVALSLACLGGCFGDDDLPEETQEGKNTFGMLVDGNKWETNPFVGIFGPQNEGAIYFQDQLFLWARKRRESSSSESIVLVIYPVDSEGEYKISFTDPRNIRPDCTDSTRFKTSENCRESFFLLDNQYNTLKINLLDTTERIVAGTFSLDMQNSKGDLIEIREGRFDLKY